MQVDGVFEGGGVKGIALVGALTKAEEEGLEFKRVAGTSAGAIVASLYAAGYMTSEMLKLLNEGSFKQFLDKEPLEQKKKEQKKHKWLFAWLKKKINFLKLIVLKVVLKYGIYEGDCFYNWIKERLKEKGVEHFSDLKIPLKIIASDITNKRMLVFDSKEHKDLEVARAVRMSMSIPIFFYPYKWFDKKFKRECLVVDGGILSNYPIHIFDDIKNRARIGFKLIAEKELQPPEPITNIISYLKSLINTMMEAHEKIHVSKADWAKTIPIPTGKIKTTQFELTQEEKDWLYISGYKAAEKFLKVRF